jgi:pimeloyl-ACP methyl ester carboxylesterase
MVALCNYLKLNICLVDYRGYGRSHGKPSSEGVLKDSNIAMRFLLGQKRIEDIFVWGESLGGSPACYVASKYPGIRGLILLSTFTSLHSLLSKAETSTRRLLFALARIATVDINENTNNALFLSKVTSPVLIIHSKYDTLIPYQNAEDLYKSASSCQHPVLLTIEGDHDSPKFDIKAIKGMIDFVGANDKLADDILSLVNSIGADRKMEEPTL